jgi:alpha- and gamma-adaptin-binding protein p34
LPLLIHLNILLTTTEKTGIPRLLEALEANDWELVGAGGDDDDDGLFGSFQDIKFPGTGGSDDDDINFDDPESVDFGFDRDEFAGLRQAIWQQQTAERPDDDEDEDKDQAAIMENMLRRLQAARLQSELLTPAQRRAMAARVVGEVMKEI